MGSCSQRMRGLWNEKYFDKLSPVILTNSGSEFSNSKAIEPGEYLVSGNGYRRKKLMKSFSS